MTTTSSKYRVILLDAKDGSGDCMLPIPDYVMAKLEWNIGDSLAIEKLSDVSS